MKWAAPAGGGGKVLQVVQATTNTSTTINSTTYSDTTISASITPTASTSKILVMANCLMSLDSSNQGNVYGALQIVRGSTAVFTQSTSGGAQSFAFSGFNGFIATTLPITYLDSPATTSSTTYKIQARLHETNFSRSLVMQYNSAYSVITLVEIGA